MHFRIFYFIFVSQGDCFRIGRVRLKLQIATVNDWKGLRFATAFALFSFNNTKLIIMGRSKEEFTNQRAIEAQEETQIMYSTQYYSEDNLSKADLLKELSKPLPVDDISFRVQSINNAGYATILAYKDARVDMKRLDAVVGRGNWKREHYEMMGFMCCRVSIKMTDGEWVPMEDVGIESNMDAPKGLFSDSFKRACFNWGIGRELYNYPTMQLKLKPDEYNGKRQTYKLDIKSWQKHVTFNEDCTIKQVLFKEGDLYRFYYNDGKILINQPKKK